MGKGVGRSGGIKGWSLRDTAKMARQTLQFLLVPDGSAGRRVRRVIAEQGARSGVVVGTWPELVEWARRAYLLPTTKASADSSTSWALGL